MSQQVSEWFAYGVIIWWKGEQKSCKIWKIAVQFMVFKLKIMKVEPEMESIDYDINKLFFKVKREWCYVILLLKNAGGIVVDISVAVCRR